LACETIFLDTIPPRYKTAGQGLAEAAGSSFRFVSQPSE
jgi:hypothetical protein